jgi:drug/metabolite transporter (DMT)-like permease
MIINGLVVAGILGICPLMEKHILGYIETESFLVLCASLFFVITAVYVYVHHSDGFMRDVKTIHKNGHLFPMILVFVVLFYGVAHYMYLQMINDHGHSRVMSLISLYPFITVVLAFLFLDDTISFTQLVGGIVTMTGIGIMVMT